MSPFPQPLDATPFGLPVRLGEAVVDLTPLGVPFRVAGQVFDYLEDKQKTGTRKTIDNKPYIYDPKTNKYVPDTSTPEGADAWRKGGTKATLGQKPVVWDDVTKKWLVDFSQDPGSSTPPLGAPPAPPVDVDAPPAPALPPPLETRPDTTQPSSPLEGQKPDFDPKMPYEYTEKLIRDYFLPLRESERREQLRENVITAALRDRAIQKLTERQLQKTAMEQWTALQQVREQARAARDISLASTVYLAGLPNEGTMRAMNEATKAAMQQVQLPALAPIQSRNYFN